MITEKWVCFNCTDDEGFDVSFEAQGNEESVAKSVGLFKSQHKGNGHKLKIRSRMVDSRRTFT